MSWGRNTLATGTTIHTNIRFQVLDPATDPAGNVKSAGELRFSTAEIDNAIKSQLVDMSNVQDAFSPSKSIKSVDVTLVDGVGTIPASVGLLSAPISKVELLDSSSDMAAILAPVPHSQLTDWPGTPVYALVGGTDLTVSDVILHVRPRTNDDVRIWYIAPPIVPSTTADNYPMTDRWQELLELGASLKLLMPTGDATDDQRIRFVELKGQFVEFCDRIRGPRRAMMRDW